MLLSIQNLHFSFGARTLFEDVSWQIGYDERIGLVGSNGTGKSTLLRLITKQYTPNSGTISKPKDVKIGFFNQDLLSFSTDNSILEVAMGAFETAQQYQKTMDELLKKLETDPDNEQLLDAYAHTLHDFEMAGGYEMDHTAAQVLEGLGFSTGDLSRPYSQFSGGWRMRVLLAKMMLQKPDILMLDEPTNHLDLPSIEWLERYLQSYPGSVIIVSHDRYFLDRMVTKIVEVWQRDLVSYSGNYSFYLKEKAERIALQQRAFENQQDYIRQQERFIERFKAKATKAAQAQSALKKLDKLDRIEAPVDDNKVMRINFNVDVQPGKILSELKQVSKAYGDNILLKNADAVIERGDKIALIGANGKGKSTLLRLISGSEQPNSGEVKGGHNVMMSFYAQHQLEALDLSNDILEEMKQHSNGKNELELRQLLGCFLFSGDDVFKKIKVLSGGEKARVALAKVINARSNFIMLDEPTNHLDIQSVEMLVEALNGYEGTYVLVSHDRYFIQQTANKFWEIEDGKIVEFKGPYDEYLIWKEEKLKRQQLEKAIEPIKPVVKQDKPKVKQQNDDALKQDKKVYQQKQKQFEKQNQSLETLYEKKKALESELADPNVYSDKVRFQELDKHYKALQASLYELESEQEQLLLEIMELEERIG